eukprot:4076874-Pleurochrysis_carterae.AAC.8
MLSVAHQDVIIQAVAFLISRSFTLVLTFIPSLTLNLTFLSIESRYADKWAGICEVGHVDVAAARSAVIDAWPTATNQMRLIGPRRISYIFLQQRPPL